MSSGERASPARRGRNHPPPPQTEREGSFIGALFQRPHGLPPPTVCRRPIPGASGLIPVGSCSRALFGGFGVWLLGGLLHIPRWAVRPPAIPLTCWLASVGVPGAVAGPPSSRGMADVYFFPLFLGSAHSAPRVHTNSSGVGTGTGGFGCRPAVWLPCLSCSVLGCGDVLIRWDDRWQTLCLCACTYAVVRVRACLFVFVPVPVCAHAPACACLWRQAFASVSGTNVVLVTCCERAVSPIVRLCAIVHPVAGARAVHFGSKGTAGDK